MKVSLQVAALGTICAVYLSSANPNIGAKPSPFSLNDPRLPGTYRLLYSETNGFIYNLDCICEQAYCFRDREHRPDGYFKTLLQDRARMGLGKPLSFVYLPWWQLPNPCTCWFSYTQTGLGSSDDSLPTDETLFSNYYFTRCTETICTIDLVSPASSSGMCDYLGIYKIIDDVLVEAYTTPEPGRDWCSGIRPSSFSGPFLPGRSLINFSVSLKCDGNMSKDGQPKPILEMERCADRKNIDISGDYIWAAPIPTETLDSYNDRLAKLLHCLDKVEISEQYPNGYYPWTRSQAVLLARAKFGHLYPLRRCSIREGTFLQHHTLLDKPTPKFRFRITGISGNGGYIDLYPLDDGDKSGTGKPFPGIFYVLDDFLLLCYNDWRTSGLPTEERPHRFMSNKEKPYTVEVLRRLHDADLPQPDSVTQ
jgi:hypothetical protein